MDPDIFDLVYATATKETVIAPRAEADSPAAALERLTKASAGKFISAIVD
jgi:hypothetical protein